MNWSHALHQKVHIYLYQSRYAPPYISIDITGFLHLEGILFFCFFSPWSRYGHRGV